VKERGSIYALSSCVAAALIVGCGVLRQAQDDTPPVGELGAMPQSRAIASAPADAGRTGPAWSYRILHTFKIRRGDRGEGYANGGLVAVGDTLYGTAFAGGGSGGCNKDEERGCGTVDSITTTGSTLTERCTARPVKAAARDAAAVQAAELSLV
jgi:hypothetical protein